MKTNMTTYTLEEIQKYINQYQVVFYTDGIMITDMSISDDPDDYETDEDFNNAHECFLRFSWQDGDWVEINDVWFPRNRNQVVEVDSDGVIYLYDTFGECHKIIPYFRLPIQKIQS
jgi:hypothetical protein